MIVAIDAILINCTLLMLNREPRNLIRNPAMRLRTWINRGIQAGKGSPRKSSSEGSNVKISVELWSESRALINKSPTSPRARLPLAKPILLA
jgi:hypothetical protein